jgi:hypothetical protein
MFTFNMAATNPSVSRGPGKQTTQCISKPKPYYKKKQIPKCDKLMQAIKHNDDKKHNLPTKQYY